VGQTARGCYGDVQMSNELIRESDQIRPGVMRCAKCSLVLLQSVMNANSGTMTANASPARCPNECGPMWHVTWKEAALTAEADAERAFDRIAKLERENEAPYRPMRIAPKNGHAVLALVEGSDIPRAIRWLASDDPRALSGAGWYMTWDDTFIDPANDGPRYWMPIADDPDAIDNGTYNPKIGGEE